MKTKMKFLMYGLTVLTMFMTSCSKDGEAGSIGPLGPQGEQGIQGPQGTPGEDGEAQGVPGPQGEQGSPGQDGQDGEDGEDGEDGNANVNTYVYDFSGKFGAYFNVDVPPITADVLENDLILAYLKPGRYMPIPCPLYVDAIGEPAAVTVEIIVGKYLIGFYEVGTSSLKNVRTRDSEELKVVIVKSNSTTGKSSAASLRSELKSKGVDTNDYYAVMDHFGLAY